MKMNRRGFMKVVLAAPIVGLGTESRAQQFKCIGRLSTAKRTGHDPNKMYCTVCDVELTDTNGSSVIGISMNFCGDHIETKRAKRIFGKTEFNVCHICWLKSLGVKTIRKD